MWSPPVVSSLSIHHSVEPIHPASWGAVEAASNCKITSSCRACSLQLIHWASLLLLIYDDHRFRMSVVFVFDRNALQLRTLAEGVAFIAKTFVKEQTVL